MKPTRQLIIKREDKEAILKGLELLDIFNYYYREETGNDLVEEYDICYPRQILLVFNDILTKYNFKVME